MGSVNGCKDAGAGLDVLVGFSILVAVNSVVMTMNFAEKLLEGLVFLELNNIEISPDRNENSAAHSKAQRHPGNKVEQKQALRGEMN